MKTRVLLFILLVVFCFYVNPFTANAQDSPCYIVNSIPYTPDSLIAPIAASFVTSDNWSNVINIGFTFCYFGNAYNQCVIGNNGCIGFNISNGNVYHSWPISQAMPSGFPADLRNTIMFPWQDLNGAIGGTIQYQTLGISPNRRFVVKFKDVKMYSCNNLVYSGQAAICETSNDIEIQIENKQLCSGWNGGSAIEGIQNATGTDAEIISGRNYPVQWTASSEAVRISPVCTCPIGIEELYSLSPKVHPNPTSSSLTLETNSNNFLTNIIIYSTDGRKVREEILSSKEEKVELNLSGLAGGIYFLDCVGEKGRQMVKVVKY
jgi:hypothetical protein